MRTQHSIGLDVLGAETAMVPFGPPRTTAMSAKQRHAALAAMNKVLIGGIVGTLLGGVGGALAWKAHRVWGLIIFSILGGGIGSQAGMVFSQKDIEEGMGD